MSEPEIWRDIPGWEGLYQASSIGRVRSLPRTIRAISRWGSLQIYEREGKLLKFKTDKDGYFCCHLANGDRDKHYKVHQLVCMAFHGLAPSSRHVVAHGDGVRKNCRSRNLRWATHKENHADRRAHGTHPSGEQHGRAKLALIQVREIRRRNAAGETQTALGKEYRMSQTSVGKIVRNLAWANL